MIIHPTNKNVAIKEYLSSEFNYGFIQNIYDNLELLREIEEHISDGVFKGEAGIKGDVGKSLIPKGTVQSISDLPMDGISNVNHMYIVLDTGDMYIYNDLGVKLNYGNIGNTAGTIVQWSTLIW